MGAVLRFCNPLDPSGGGLPDDLALFREGKPSKVADSAFGEMFDAMSLHAKTLGLRLGYSNDGVIMHGQKAIHYIQATIFAMDTAMSPSEASSAGQMILQASAQGLSDWHSRAAPQGEHLGQTMEMLEFPARASSQKNDFATFSTFASSILGAQKERDALDGALTRQTIPAQKQPPRI